MFIRKNVRFINQNIPVCKSVWMNKSKFFTIYIVPAIPILLLKKCIKIILKIIPFLVNGTQKILLVLRQNSKKKFPRVFIVFPEFFMISLSFPKKCQQVNLLQIVDMLSLSTFCIPILAIVFKLI